MFRHLFRFWFIHLISRVNWHSPCYATEFYQKTELEAKKCIASEFEYCFII